MGNQIDSLNEVINDAIKHNRLPLPQIKRLIDKRLGLVKKRWNGLPKKDRDEALLAVGKAREAWRNNPLSSSTGNAHRKLEREMA